ncbi:nucleoside-diphosphate-sugar epimerase [Pedobacter cryoconitis]|uniref:NAD-dependent epimerase/dehydratase family protein n=1 Tax=Pedobacter cryoconitis TaxID=188932 RepID=UPI0016221036|nr:NAD-dependent epimerase/dehydratase family protein [Pedobacter cryoconitis]MBB6271528.1 nucleoside-diphosphate-sugar epimerase [Pedobacter cryoconitis]
MFNLITGASGFVGKNLIPYLEGKGLRNRIISRSELNDFNPDNLSDCISIIHLAGKAHDLSKTSNPDEYYHVNYELTKRLYDAFLSSKAKQFIFVSSVKAAADEVKGVLLEEGIPNPKTVYGKSKLMAEEYIKSQPLPEGKSYFILRPCMIHGPGNKGNLNLLYQVVRKGIPYPLAGFENKRSFLSVENLCFVINELITRTDIPSGVYNVADDETQSTSDVVTILAASLHKKVKLWAISPSLIRFIASIGTRLHLPLTTERLTKLTESYIVSNEKLTWALNKPFPLSAQKGLEITASSFRKA